MMMQDVGRRYVRLFNDTHKRTGTLWEGRYKAAMIDSERYFLYLPAVRRAQSG